MKGVGKECAKRLGLGVDGQIPLFHHSKCYWGLCENFDDI